ncbi:hypothetical protein J4460_04155 [Candidatus Woesearchaeota archaeon]|nr:hypothetical protein [Candidatus Woesearchaeota archaeon]HIH38103.1 hypothetical protein [Candidatus Woesearchaeota archaeon]HIH48837.1 hypothetical protein [Candidatus Woesearchaeota archaeon]HIJ03164.1 hypothetical protein [Candidatus Woesearchaeota archaeon]
MTHVQQYVHQGPLLFADIRDTDIFSIGAFAVDIRYRGEDFSLLHFPLSGMPTRPDGMACRCENVPDSLLKILAYSIRARTYWDVTSSDPALYLFQPREHNHSLGTVIETYLALLGPSDPAWREELLCDTPRVLVTAMSLARVLSTTGHFSAEKLEPDPDIEATINYAQEYWEKNFKRLPL